MYPFKILALFILTAYFSSCVSEDSPGVCTRHSDCASCIQTPECKWCSKSDFHGQDKKPLPRCNTVEGHEQLGGFQCGKDQLFGHKNEMSITRDESLSNGNDDQKAVPIQPQKVSLRMRVNDPVQFPMKYKEVEDYPLELYYLMDGTFSMKDDQEVLVGLGDSIGERLRNLTSKYRQGFGTFVDKVMMPYVVTIKNYLENPCSTKNHTCTRPYGFKNRMNLSNNTKEFSNVVKNVVLSGSSDLPEGGLDALMQVIVCEEQIGWSQQARRLVIFATDAPFHFAGDGKLGGLLVPNDGKCHMDEKGEYYTHSLKYDYPSMAQVNSKAKEHSTNIIFAVTSDEIDDYRRLTSVIEGSKSTELASNSSNIVDLVEEEYLKISSTVEIKDSFPAEYFKVKYYSKCLDNVERERRSCEGLQAGSVVEFRVEIELIKCLERKEQWKQQYRIYAVGVPDSIEIDVETLCDCPCENPENRIPNSSMCNRKGTEICGLCECNENYFGKTCECSADAGRSIDLSTACKYENSTEICSGRGNCLCGQCTCIESERYSGSFCECDNNNCVRTNGIECAGNGKCDCGVCKCNHGWEGVGCACSTVRSTCFEPESEEECSGHGSCVCGKCQCKRTYNGEYCEQCVHESCYKCEELKHCVQCKLYGTGIYNPAECELSCFQHSINRVEVVSPVSGIGSNEIICKAEDPSDECVFIFSYVALRNKPIQINAQNTKECPPIAPIFWILASVSGLVILIGLILLCVYKAYTKIQIKREFAAYEDERVGVVWAKETNPLYNNPVGTFQNPMYAGVDK
ncbi:unnamed protein product [Orchesella dallaii]|uniref:Integrin beta n=1 Tax=Orchesella dallaii TaxID=48710 RepID=A0ABP1QE98_9HEXA